MKADCGGILAHPKGDSTIILGDIEKGPCAEGEERKAR